MKSTTGGFKNKQKTRVMVLRNRKTKSWSEQMNSNTIGKGPTIDEPDNCNKQQTAAFKYSTTEMILKT